MIVDDDGDLRERFARGLEQYFAENSEPSEITVNLCGVWREWGWEASTRPLSEGDFLRPPFPASFFAWMERNLDALLAMPPVEPTGFNVGPLTIIGKLDEHEGYRGLIMPERIRALSARLVAADVVQYSRVGVRMLDGLSAN